MDSIKSSNFRETNAYLPLKTSIKTTTEKETVFNTEDGFTPGESSTDDNTIRSGLSRIMKGGAVLGALSLLATPLLAAGQTVGGGLGPLIPFAVAGSFILFVNAIAKNRQQQQTQQPQQQQ